jgi:MbtH protein
MGRSIFPGGETRLKPRTRCRALRECAFLLIWTCHASRAGARPYRRHSRIARERVPKQPNRRITSNLATEETESVDCGNSKKALVWAGFLQLSHQMNDSEQDKIIYKVVINHEEQYSIWPADRENPLGWRDAGKQGPKQECLDYIKEVWTDMRPLSLRKQMDAAQST